MSKVRDGLNPEAESAPVEPPYAMLAELTYRCPLRCPYCSNPRELVARAQELSTAEWLRVTDEAAKLGVVQVHLSGGEPLLYPDLDEIISNARRREIYTNLITSGIGLTLGRARKLSQCGLDSVQLSLQASRAELSDRIAGFTSFDTKAEAARACRQADLPLSMNVVVHRHNIAFLEEIIDLCASWGAHRLEIANAQYYGWALANRAWLLPSADDLKQAESVYLRKMDELKGKLELIFVLSDYYETYPKPCMGGWARLQFTVRPDGTVLPCPAAGEIADMTFESVRTQRLDYIWYRSSSFNRFRGFSWMPEPCRSCERRSVDFGGCRCQAFALTGDAAKTDPVCALSPDRAYVDRAIADAEKAGEAADFARVEPIYRQFVAD